jgi:hypothetical protein
MTWHYVEDGQKAGPVTEEQLEQLFQNGKITPDTLVWRDGLPDWVPYRQAMSKPAAPPVSQPPLAGVVTSPGANQAVCAECGQYFPPDELVTLNRTQVCANCKPIFLQRMAEGVPTSGAAGIWREGKKLVTRSETPFPDRCVKCNAPANGFRLKRVLYWQHPAYYLLILCNLLVLLIVLLVVRKKAVLHVGLCEAHRKQRQTAIIACSVGILGGLAMIIAGAMNESVWLAVGGILIFFAGIIWGILKGRTVAASKIDKENVWVSGVCKEFLDELPER